LFSKNKDSTLFWFTFHRFISNVVELQLTSPAVRHDSRDQQTERSTTVDGEHSLRLSHMSRGAALRLSTDAVANIAAGAVLEQNIRSQWQPMGFFSQKSYLPPNKDTARTTENFSPRICRALDIEGAPQDTIWMDQKLIYVFTFKAEKIIDWQVVTTNIVSASIHTQRQTHIGRQRHCHTTTLLRTAVDNRSS